MPWLWIVAGPNGSGKTSLVRTGFIQRTSPGQLITLNADDRTALILATDPAEPNANLRAAIEIDAELAACIERGDDVLVETVLSSDKYLDDIDRARSLGYRVGMIYVCLRDAAASVHRVALRHRLGGHDVPQDRIIQRWHRSIEMLGRVVPQLHELYVFDNTDDTGAPVMIARKCGTGFHLLHPNRIPEIDAVLIANGAITP